MFSWNAIYTFLDPNGDEQKGRVLTSGWTAESAMYGLIERFESTGLEIIQVTVTRKKKLLSLFSEMDVEVTDSWSKANI